MSARLLVPCALAVFAPAATPAVAQDATTLRGPWLGAGLGTASAQVNCDLCASDRNGGLSGYVAGGFRVAPNLHAGLELAGWFDNTEGVSQRLMLYGASLWWHPQRGARWFLTSRSRPAPRRSSWAAATTSGPGRRCGSHRSRT